MAGKADHCGCAAGKSPGDEAGRGQITGNWKKKWLYAVAKVFEMDGAVSYLHLESVHDKITICMKGQKVYDIDQIVSFTFDETKYISLIRRQKKRSGKSVRRSIRFEAAK